MFLASRATAMIVYLPLRGDLLQSRISGVPCFGNALKVRMLPDGAFSHHVMRRIEELSSEWFRRALPNLCAGAASVPGPLSFKWRGTHLCAKLESVGTGSPN